MREFPNNAVFVSEGEYDPRVMVAETVGHSGRLYCAANNTAAGDTVTPESTGARFRASLWLGIAADIRRGARGI